MKHSKISALKIAFLQIFPAQNKFENYKFFLLKINLKIKSTLKLGKNRLFLMISNWMFLKMECNYFQKLGDES